MTRRRRPGLFDAATIAGEPPSEETRDFYAIVTALRERGHRVYRAGADTMLDGRRLSPAQFRKISALLLREAAPQS